MNTIYSPKTMFQITFLVLQMLLCEQAIAQNITNKSVLWEHRQTYSSDIYINTSYTPDIGTHSIPIYTSNQDSTPTFQTIQLISQEVDRDIASAFLEKEQLYYAIHQGIPKQDVHKALQKYGTTIHNLGAQYNILQHQIMSYIENKKNNASKDTIYALVAYQQQTYQSIKNLFTGSYRFWVQQYQNPYYNATFEQFLSLLPQYQEHYAHSFDISNDIEDPANSLYLTQYELCNDHIQNLTKACSLAIDNLNHIQQNYNIDQNEQILASELKAFKSTRLDPIYKELGLTLSLFNNIAQNQVFHYMKFYNVPRNANIVKSLETSMKVIGCIEKDISNESVSGACDVLFEKYNKLAMLSGGTSNK